MKLKNTINILIVSIIFHSCAYHQPKFYAKKNLVDKKEKLLFLPYVSILSTNNEYLISRYAQIKYNNDVFINIHFENNQYIRHNRYRMHFQNIYNSNETFNLSNYVRIEDTIDYKTNYITQSFFTNSERIRYEQKYKAILPFIGKIIFPNIYYTGNEEIVFILDFKKDKIKGYHYSKGLRKRNHFKGNSISENQFILSDYSSETQFEAYKYHGIILNKIIFIHMKRGSGKKDSFYVGRLVHEMLP